MVEERLPASSSHTLEHERILSPRDLTLVLVTRSCNGELMRMGWTLTALDGGVYTVIAAFTDEVAETEADDFLRIFSHHECETREAAWWWQRWTAEDKAMENLKDLEGYEEMAEKVFGSLPLESRLRTIKPEQRLADLTPEQQILALSDEVLHGFQDDYLRSLSPETQEAIRKRIGRPARF